MSSRSLNTFIDGALVTCSGNRFQFSITLLLKKCCLNVVLYRGLWSFRLWPLMGPSSASLSRLLSGMSSKSYRILYVCIMSPLFLLYPKLGSFSCGSLSLYGRSLMPGTSFVSPLSLGVWHLYS